VDLSLGGRRETELNGGRKILHDPPPRALVVGPATVAFVDNDEVEEVARVLAEVGRGISLGVGPRHEGLEDGEEQARILRHPLLLANLTWINPGEGVFGEGVEGEISLIGQDIAIGQEQYSRPPSRL